MEIITEWMFHIVNEVCIISHFQLMVCRGATEQLTLAERGKFHENSTQFLGSSACVYITTYRTGYVFISRQALAWEGDYKIHPVHGCVCALVCRADFSKTATATDFL